MPRKRKPVVFDYVPERLRPRLSRPPSKHYRVTLMRGLLTEIEVGSGIAPNNGNGTTSFSNRNGQFSGSAGSSIDRAFNFNKR